MQNTIHIMSNIRVPPLCGGRHIMISLSVRPCVVTNRVRAVTVLSFKTGFAYLTSR
jgi:hypothetical protein